MKTKNSKKILSATVFAAIIVLLAFSVMSTTATQVEKTLNPEEGGLGDVVNVTINVTVTADDGAVTVVDTLPSELSYITETFTVDDLSATPTVEKRNISYTITTEGDYTIEFDVKVTEASWKVLEVCNAVVVTNVSGNTSSDTANFNISAFDELWKEAEGLLTIPVETEYQWTLVINVTNPFDYTMENTVITDRFGAEIEIDEPFPAEMTQGTVSWDYGPGKRKPNKSQKVFLTWEIGDLLSGETAELTLNVSTDLNPAGWQEYTSPGEDYEMNSGATLKFIDPEQDMQLSAVTDSIYVTVEGEEAP